MFPGPSHHKSVYIFVELLGERFAVEYSYAVWILLLFITYVWLEVFSWHRVFLCTPGWLAGCAFSDSLILQRAGG